MEEQLISFDTAKLAKEKGFKATLHSYYKLSEELYTDKYNWDSTVVGYLAPTQSLLQKWLREKYGMKVFCIPTPGVRWQVWKLVVNQKAMSESDMIGVYKSYEEALEKGLQEALKLIK